MPTIQPRAAMPRPSSCGEDCAGCAHRAGCRVLRDALVVETPPARAGDRMRPGEGR